MQFPRRDLLALAGASALSPLSAAPRGFRFEYWDVFTKSALTGNPLAVFKDASGMSDALMQAIARETNLSETTFVQPRDAATEQAKGVRVRIFSPTEEYPFAGHPTLGTAMALRKPGQQRIVLEENVGPVPVRFEEQAGGLVYGEMTQPDAVFAETHPPAEIASLLNVSASELLPDAPVVNVSTGRPNLIVVLRSLKTIRALQPDWAKIRDYFASGDRQRGLYFLTPEVESKNARFHARKLGPRSEDPATGSAAGCAAAYLVAHGIVKPDERIVIEQGYELKRPGELYVTAAKRAGKITDVRVGGYCAKVLSGELTV